MYIIWKKKSSPAVQKSTIGHAFGSYSSSVIGCIEKSRRVIYWCMAETATQS